MKCYQRDDLIVLKGHRHEQWIARKTSSGMVYRAGIDSGDFTAAAIANFIGASATEVQIALDVIKLTANTEEDTKGTKDESGE